VGNIHNADDDTTNSSNNVIQFLPYKEKKKLKEKNKQISITEFENYVKSLINRIIYNWVTEFLDRTWQSTSDSEVVKYIEDVEWIVRGMIIMAETINNTLKYLEELTGDEFYPSRVLNIMEDLLSFYTDEVFELLMKNYWLQNILGTRSEIDSDNGLNDNTVEISLSSNVEELSDLSKIQKILIWIVQSIVKDWISDFLKTSSHITTPLTIKMVYNEDIQNIFNKMLFEVFTIMDVIFYLEENADAWHDEGFLVFVVTEMLSYYREVVFHLLVNKYFW